MNAPASRQRRKVEERREQLLDLALELFIHRTYEELSIDDIAQAAGISKGLLYHYFPSKRAFYVAAVGKAADHLLEATEAVKRGDLDARVPVVSGDEIGALAGSFNEMMQGLQERDRLRTAFGSYVDPEVAERVLEEGELLEGQELEVTVMFVDLRDFTARAARSSARETVALLNEYLDVVGGHGALAAEAFVDLPPFTREQQDRLCRSVLTFVELDAEASAGLLRYYSDESNPIIPAPRWG